MSNIVDSPRVQAPILGETGAKLIANTDANHVLGDLLDSMWRVEVPKRACAPEIQLIRLLGNGRTETASGNGLHWDVRNVLDADRHG